MLFVVFLVGDGVGRDDRDIGVAVVMIFLYGDDDGPVGVVFYGSLARDDPVVDLTAKELLLGMLNKDVTQRFRAKDVLRHRWITEVGSMGVGLSALETAQVVKPRQFAFESETAWGGTRLNFPWSSVVCTFFSPLRC